MLLQLDDAALGVVFSYVGPGHWLFVAILSKRCKELYERSGNATMLGVDLFEEQVEVVVTPQTALTRSVLASAACLQYALDNGLQVKPDTQSLFLVGQFADINTLSYAHRQGLRFTYRPVHGAALSGSLTKLKWLLEEKHCILAPMIGDFAARSGSIDMLLWIAEKGGILDKSTCTAAARAGHLHVLQHLHAINCKWDANACSAAARKAHLPVLQWLHEHGCAWDAATICNDAAEGGSIEMLRYLNTCGLVFDADTMSSAALNGRLEVVKYLHEVGCPWDEDSCQNAVFGGHTDTLRFLHEHGCPWRSEDIHLAAAEEGHIDTM
jgi:hypothetical protein